MSTSQVRNQRAQWVATVSNSMIFLQGCTIWRCGLSIASEMWTRIRRGWAPQPLLSTSGAVCDRVAVKPMLTWAVHRYNSTSWTQAHSSRSRAHYRSKKRIRRAELLMRATVQDPIPRDSPEWGRNKRQAGAVQANAEYVDDHAVRSEG
eukprot:scaffold1664_cov351-Prasinococcus_capsulatus_cf.AAC.9